MGLLDQWTGDTDLQSPQNQQMMSIAAALLQAGGPSRTPVSFGQAFGNAMQAGQQAFQGAKDRKLAEDYKNEQLKLLKLDELRKQTEFNNKQKWFELANGTDQAATAPTQSIQQPLKLGMNADGGMGFQSQPNIQAQQNPASQAQGKTWLDRMSLADLALGEQMGVPVKSAIEAKKFMLTGIKRDPNSFVEDMNGNVRYIGDPTKGLDYNPETKTVTGLTGFNQANAAMKGAETLAQEQAKAQFNPMIINGVDEYGRSRPEQTTVADFVQQRQGLQQPQQGQMPQGQQVQPQQAPNGQQTGPQGLDISRLTPQQLQVLQRRDPEAFYNGMNDFAQTRGQASAPSQGMQQPQTASQQQFAPQQAFNQPRFGIPLQSEAQKAEELANVKLRTEPTLTQQVGAVSGKQGTTNALNENWIKQSYNPVLEAGKTSRDILGGLDALKTIDLKTGWGTEAKANAANILTSLGIAPKNAELYATNAQRFQSVAMGKLLDTLAAQKGPQTEGDAQRAQKTFTMLSNTPQANQFIADFARAKANLDARKAAFYQEALPIAQQTGDLNEIDRRWMKLQGSIWSDPVLQQYKLGAK